MVDPRRGSVDRNKYMTRTEAADYLGIPFNRIGPLIRRGELRGVQRGHWFYVDRASAHEYKRRNHR